MNLLLTLTLVLFELSISLVHSLPRSEHDTDAYVIQEGNSSPVRIVNPKPDKPTLREIVYYHLIEKPYGDEELTHVNRNKETIVNINPRFENTARPFTNGHGYQFVDVETPENKTDIINEEITEESDVDDVNNTEEQYVIYYDESSEEVNSLEPNITTTDAVNEDSEESFTDITSQPEDIATAPEADAATESSTSVEEKIIEPEIRTTTEDDVVMEKKTARNLLFNQLKERYQKQRRPFGKSSRRKREAMLEDIPDGPRLLELNYNLLPDYVRKMISTEKPVPPVTLKDSDEVIDTFKEYNEEDMKKEMERRLEAIFDDLEQLDENEDEETEKEREPRTYGMNLTMNGGYVWNDLLNNPGVSSYEVGDVAPDNNDVDNEHDDNDDIKENEDANKKPTKPDNNEEDLKPTNHNDLDDVLVHTNKDTSTSRSPVEKKILKTSVVTDKLETEKSPNDDDDKGSNGSGNIMQAKKIDMLIEIMKDERFWKWLAEWTSTYMELLTKYVTRIVREEIARQLKSHLDHLLSSHFKHNDPTDIPINPSKDVVEENSTTKDTEPETIIKGKKLLLDGKEIPITNSSNFDQTNLTDKSSNMLRKHNKKNFLGLPGLNKPNTDKDKDSNKPNNDSKKETPVTIEAQNIYGNAMNSENVTNIFIFLANQGAANTFKPVTNDTQAMFNFGKDKDNKNTQTLSETTTETNYEENKTFTSVVTENMIEITNPEHEAEDPKTTTENIGTDEMEENETTKKTSNHETTEYYKESVEESIHNIPEHDSQEKQADIETTIENKISEHENKDNKNENDLEKENIGESTTELLEKHDAKLNESKPNEKSGEINSRR